MRNAKWAQRRVICTKCFLRVAVWIFRVYKLTSGALILIMVLLSSHCAGTTHACMAVVLRTIDIIGRGYPQSSRVCTAHSHAMHCIMQVNGNMFISRVWFVHTKGTCISFFGA
jgi:hypothetical protein